VRREWKDRALMTPVQRFTALLATADDVLVDRLEEAALAMAAHVRGDAVDAAVDAGLATLDAFAVGVEPSLAGLEERLFADLGLLGDTESYDAPENSYVDAVLERRRGLPITLAVIAIAVGRRAGVELAPVGMPGHFLVRHEGQPRVLLDCFDGGRRLTSGDCEAIVHGLYGPDTGFELAWLRPVGPRSVLARMLSNLAGSASRREDRALFARVVELHGLLSGET
jgi:regulator of sirC expression with transglutaminase-like and TPR domain